MPTAKVYSATPSGTDWVTIRDVAGLASDFGVSADYVTDEHFAAIVINGDLNASHGVVSGKVYDGYGLQVKCVENGGKYRVICTVIRL